MSEPLNWIPEPQPSAPAMIACLTDSLALKLHWRRIIRPASLAPEVTELRINWTPPLPDYEERLRRWRPGSAPAQPVPRWRWPSRASARRASSRGATKQRWRPLSVR
jgi:hypothetical protein